MSTMQLSVQTKNPSLYIVTTDYDLSRRDASLSREELEEMMADDPNFVPERDILHDSGQFIACDGKNLVRRIREVRPNESIVPHVEFRRGYIQVWAGTSGFMYSPELVDYDLLRRTILLEGRDVGEEMRWIRDRVPPHILTIDLIFNYASNRGKYDALLAETALDFDVRKIDVFR